MNKLIIGKRKIKDEDVISQYRRAVHCAECGKNTKLCPECAGKYLKTMQRLKEIRRL